MEETRLFLPVGCKFRPSDEELVEYYLYRKVSGLPIPYVHYMVKECDLYGKQEPWQIWESNGGTLLKEDDDLYFFTKLKKKMPKGSRINRKIGSGAWQGEDAPKDIISSKSNKLIGSKKRFRYEKEGSEENGCWIMHEYTLHPSLLGKNQSMDYVLCRIRCNGTGTGKNKKLSLRKKRKLQDFQNSNQSVEKFLTEEENKKVLRMNHGECQSSAMFTDMMIEQSFQRREAGGIDYSSVAIAGQYEVPDETIQTLTRVQSAEQERMSTQQENQKISSYNYNYFRSNTGGIDSSGFVEELGVMMLQQDNEVPMCMTVPDESIQTLPMLQEENQQPICVDDFDSRYEASLAIMRQKISSASDNNHNFQGTETGGIVSSNFTEHHEAPVAVVPDHQVVMLKQDNEYDPLSEICDEDMCLLRWLLNKEPTGESVELESMPCMKETVIVPTDGEIATSTGVDRAETLQMQTMDEMQLLNVPDNYGSTCSSLCLSVDDYLPFIPHFYDGEDYCY